MRQRKHSLFLRYVMTYMIVCIASISVFAAFLYATSVKDAQKTTRAVYEALIARGGGMLNERMGSLYELSVVLQARNALDEIARIPSPITPESVSAIIAFSRELQPYNYANSFFRELILFFTRSNMFISSASIGLYPSVYYDVTLRYPNLSYDAWRAQINKPQFMTPNAFTDNRTGARYIDILQDLSPTSRAGHGKALMIARIGESDLLSGFESALDQGGIFLIHDRNSSLAYASTTTPELADFSAAQTAAFSIAGKRFIPLSYHMPTIGWTCSLLMPESIFLAAEQQLIRTLIILVLAVLLTGVILSVLLSFWGVMPIRKLLRAFLPADGDAKGGNEYAHLNAHIQDMLKNNARLRDEVGHYMAMSRSGFIDKLLGAGFASKEEMLGIAQHHGLVLEYNCYMLAVFELVGYNSEIHTDFLQEMDMATIVITDFLDQRVEMGAFVHKVDFSHIALIFCLDEKNQTDTVKRQLAQLLSAISDKLDLMVRCAMSGEIGDLGALGTACFALCRRLSESDAPPGQIIPLLSASSPAALPYYYPVDQEVKLLNYLSAGNEEEALALLRMLHRESIDNKQISAPDAALFYAAVRGTLIRARAEAGPIETSASVRLDQLLSPASSAFSATQWQTVSEAVTILCDAVRQRKDQRNLELINRINRFIEENYQNSLLDLTMIAQHFSLTSSYLSFFYKNSAGENLSVIIEKTRMSHAERLLKEGGHQIKDIAAMVGYTNLNTFYKAFKRVFGISPKGYYDRLRRS